MLELDHSAMLAVALAEARKGLAEGGIPIGAAIFDAAGKRVGFFGFGEAWRQSFRCLT